MLNYAYVVEAGRLARALTAAGFALPIGFLHSDKHGRNSARLGHDRAAAPLIDARVFKFIAQREFVRSDFPQAGRNAHRIDRAIIAELLRVSLLPWQRHEGRGAVDGEDDCRRRQTASSAGFRGKKIKKKKKKKKEKKREGKKEGEGAGGEKKKKKKKHR